MNKVIYSKYNIARKPEYLLITSIQQDDNGEKFVYKTAQQDSTLKFLSSLNFKYHELNKLYANSTIKILKPEYVDKYNIRYNYLGYTNLEKYLIDIFNKYGFNGLEKQIDEFYNNIFLIDSAQVKTGESGLQLFGDTSQVTKSTPLLDISFDNFLFHENNYYLIDYEWCFDNCLPTEYLKYRALINFYSRNRNILKKSSQIIKKITSDKIGYEYYNRYEIKLLTRIFKENSVKRRFDPKVLTENITIPNDLEISKQKNAHLQNKIADLQKQLEIYTIQVDSYKQSFFSIQNSLTWKLSTFIRKPIYLISILLSKLPTAIIYIKKFGLLSFVKYIISLLKNRSKIINNSIDKLPNVKIEKSGSTISKHCIEQLTTNKFVVNILHSNLTISLGGTEKYVIEDIECLKKTGIKTLTIYPDKDKFGLLLDDNLVVEEMEMNDLGLLLKKLNKSNNLKFYILHHLYKYNLSQTQLLLNTIDKNKLVVFIHDIFLIDLDTFYKQNDYNLTSPPKPQEIKEFKSIYLKFLENAQYIITPSEFLAEKLKSIYNDEINKKIRIKSHISLKPYNHKKRNSNKKLRIAYLGHDSISKGWNDFTKLTKNPELKNNYDFYHIGKYYNPQNKVSNIININYSFYDGYSYAAIRELLNNKIDIVFLWSLLPESFSYAMYEASAAAIPIITSPKSGNINFQVSNGIIYGKSLEDIAACEKFLSNAKAVEKFIQINTKKEISMISHNSTLSELIKGGKL